MPCYLFDILPAVSGLVILMYSEFLLTWMDIELSLDSSEWIIDRYVSLPSLVSWDWFLDGNVERSMAFLSEIDRTTDGRQHFYSGEA